MVDQVALQRRMSSCFHGSTARDCDTCNGHHSRTARCCFGHRFDENDTEECGECRHQVDCQVETARYEASMARPSTAVARPYISTVTRPTITSPIAMATINPANRIPVGTQTIQETAFERFMKDSLWEALIGFFNGGLGFFRTHRWR